MDSDIYEGLAEIDDNAKPNIFNRHYLDEFFNRNRGERIKITFEVVRDKKSESQLGYYFGEIVPRCHAALVELGCDFTKKESHEFLKKNASPVLWYMYEIKGKTYSKPRSLSDKDFNKKDMSQYIEDVIRFASEELGVIIEPPENES